MAEEIVEEVGDLTGWRVEEVAEEVVDEVGDLKRSSPAMISVPP